jgi:hypothetical protein
MLSFKPRAGLLGWNLSSHFLAGAIRRVQTRAEKTPRTATSIQARKMNGFTLRFSAAGSTGIAERRS